jgi:hypothetical protein
VASGGKLGAKLVGTSGGKSCTGKSCAGKSCTGDGIVDDGVETFIYTFIITGEVGRDGNIAMSYCLRHCINDFNTTCRKEVIFFVFLYNSIANLKKVT